MRGHTPFYNKCYVSSMKWSSTTTYVLNYQDDMIDDYDSTFTLS